MTDQAAGPIVRIGGADPSPIANVSEREPPHALNVLIVSDHVR
jgi:hypothetical protein